MGSSRTDQLYTHVYYYIHQSNIRAVRLFIKEPGTLTHVDPILCFPWDILDKEKRKKKAWLHQRGYEVIGKPKCLEWCLLNTCFHIMDLTPSVQHIFLFPRALTHTHWAFSDILWYSTHNVDRLGRWKKDCFGDWINLGCIPNGWEFPTQVFYIGDEIMAPATHAVQRMSDKKLFVSQWFAISSGDSIRPDLKPDSFTISTFTILFKDSSILWRGSKNKAFWGHPSS